MIVTLALLAVLLEFLVAIGHFHHEISPRLIMSAFIDMMESKFTLSVKCT